MLELPEALENDLALSDRSTSDEALKRRLDTLSALQTKMLVHAFRFPSARKVTYSTCSIYDNENEGVVRAALVSPIAQEGGWRILKRAEQVEGMKAWNVRGNIEAFYGVDNDDEVAEACIRCERDTDAGTQGFFVAAFVRELSIKPSGHIGSDCPKQDDGEEEWNGFES